MADVFTRAKRSQVMAAIRSSGNRTTELALASAFRRLGVKGWRRHANLPGKPDFVFREARLAVFVDGCFWHGCPKHGHQPLSNQSYWLKKLKKNKKRDRNTDDDLQKIGWKVLRFWEHEAKASSTACVAKVARLLVKGATRGCDASRSASPSRTRRKADHSTT
jgi:DNA mismatch endonuclease (patch repair protein)